MDADKTVTANFFNMNCNLTISITGSGTTIPEVGTHSFPRDTIVDLSATPASGWQFVNWTGDVANPNTTSTRVTMNGDKTLTANFVRVSYSLTVATSGNGSTNPAAGTSAYPVGAVVNLSATPASGWRFENWTGDVTNVYSAATTTMMNADKTVTAIFSEIPVLSGKMAYSSYRNGNT